MDCFIGLDIGTSSVKGMLLSEKAIVKTASREYPLYYPKDGWSEQNPQDWYDVSISVIKELVSDIDRNSVVSISFSGQMHGLVVLDENDNVIRPAILWNDSRSSMWRTGSAVCLRPIAQTPRVHCISTRKTAAGLRPCCPCSA